MNTKIYAISCIFIIVVIILSMIREHYNREYNNCTRDYKYEHYCDSIYKNDSDYYYDVIVESDKFQKYIKEHGEWWNK